MMDVRRSRPSIFAAESRESESMRTGDMNASNRLRARGNLLARWGACEKFHKFGLRVCSEVRTLRSNVRSMPAIALSLSLVLGFSACGPRLADRNIDAVNRLYEQA